MTGEAFLLFMCCNCGVTATACPQCVNTIAIDPTTGRPPDVVIRHGHAVHVEPTPEAAARSRQQPVCDACIMRRNETMFPRIETSDERHRRHWL